MFSIAPLRKHTVEDNVGFSLSHSSKLHTVSLTTNTLTLYDSCIVREMGNSSNSQLLI